MRLFRWVKRVEPVGTADPADMNVPDNWHRYYELCIKLGAADDLRLDRAVKAMWSAAGFGAAFRRSTDQRWSWESPNNGTVPGNQLDDNHAVSLALPRPKPVSKTSGCGHRPTSSNVGRDAEPSDRQRFAPRPRLHSVARTVVLRPRASSSGCCGSRGPATVPRRERGAPQRIGTTTLPC